MPMQARIMFSMRRLDGSANDSIGRIVPSVKYSSSKGNGSLHPNSVKVSIKQLFLFLAVFKSNLQRMASSIADLPLVSTYMDSSGSYISSIFLLSNSYNFLI